MEAVGVDDKDSTSVNSCQTVGLSKTSGNSVVEKDLSHGNGELQPFVKFFCEIL